MIDCFRQKEVEASLSTLRDARIFHIESCDPRGENFLISEEVNEHYAVVVSAGELRSIAHEILKLAGDK